MPIICNFSARYSSYTFMITERNQTLSVNGRSTETPNFFYYINPNDKVMADRGFALLGVSLLSTHAELIIPPAGKGTAQITSTHVQETKRVAHVRIHVERVIIRLKAYSYSFFNFR